MAFAMAFTMMATAGAAYTDQADIEATEAVEMLNALGVMTGDPDGAFRPNDTITRAEACRMIYTIRTGTDDASSYANMQTTFTDVSSDAWYAGYVKHCQSVGIVSGRSETTFDPNSDVTGVELALMCLRVMGYDPAKANIGGSTWSTTTIGLATEAGLLEDVTASITSACPRQFAAQIMYNMLDSRTVRWSNDSESYTDLNMGGGYMNRVGMEYLKLYVNIGTLVDVDGQNLTIDMSESDREDSDNGTQSFTNVGENYTSLLGQKVKVLFRDGKANDVIGVYATGDNTVYTADMRDIERDGSKVKFDGASYSFDDNEITAVRLDVNDEAISDTFTMSAADFDTYNDNASGSDNTAKLVPATVTFVDNDNDGKLNIAIITEYLASEVTYVGSDRIVAGTTYRMEDENIADDIEKDDWAMISYNPYDDCLDIAKADVVSDTLSGVKTETGYYQFQIGGAWYNVNTSNYNKVSSGDTVLAYVVAGIIVDIDTDDGTGAIPSNIAVVIGTGGDASVYGDQVRLRYFDGTNKIVTLSDQSKIQKPEQGLAYRVSGSDTNARLEELTVYTDANQREYNGYRLTSNAVVNDIVADPSNDKIDTNTVDDNAVIILYTAGGQSKQITGKQFKAIATTSLYATDEDGNVTDQPNTDKKINAGEAGAVFTKITNGLNRIRLAAVMVGDTSITGQSSDNYAYVTSTSYLDNNNDTVIKIWTGSENLTVTMNGSDSFPKGTLIGYSTIDSDNVIYDVSDFGTVEDATQVTTSITSFDNAKKYVAGNEDEDGANNMIAVNDLKLNVTSDTHVLMIDSANDVEADIGIKWDNSSLPSGKLVNGTHQYNVWFSTTSTGGDDTDLEVLVIDNLGVFEAFDTTSGGGNQGGSEVNTGDVQITDAEIDSNGKFSAAITLERPEYVPASATVDITFDVLLNGTRADSETAQIGANETTLFFIGRGTYATGRTVSIDADSIKLKPSEVSVQYKLADGTVLTVGEDIDATTTVSTNTAGVITVTAADWTDGMKDVTVTSNVTGVTNLSNEKRNLEVRNNSGAATAFNVMNQAQATGDGYVVVTFSDVTGTPTTDSLNTELKNGDATVAGDFTVDAEFAGVPKDRTLTVEGTVNNSTTPIKVEGTLIAQEIANINNISADSTGSIQIGGGEAIAIDDLADLSNVQANAVVAITKTSATGAELNVSGTPSAGVPRGDLADNVFNGVAAGDSNGVTVLTFDGLIPTTGTYTIEQSNPAMKIYYGSSIESSVKTSTYTNGNGGGETGGDFSILVAPDTTATLTVKDDTGAVVATYTVTASGLELS